ncbi:MAG: cytochrome c oxidase subunit II [Planctomycetota bacterium]
MSRFWSILFFAVPLLAIGVYLAAAFGAGPFAGAWMPESYSEAGDTIDHLFNFIHLICAGILLITGLAIGWILWKNSNAGSDKPALFVHHNTRLELFWSIIPAFILIFIAFYQMESWAENKMNRPQIEVGGESVDKPPMVLVRAKQFGWEFHYAGEDGLVQTADDVYVENILVVPVGEDVVLQLESRDVIHSFFVSELRLKQDIIPGMVQFAWFHANKTGELEIACTELCGWGHYKMKGLMRIVPREEYDMWIEQQTLAYQAPMAVANETEEENGGGTP